MQSTLYSAPEKSYAAYAFVHMCASSIGSFHSECDDGTHLNGAVLDSNDTPIADADVTLITGELKREVKSSHREIFKIGMTHVP